MSDRRRRMRKAGIAALVIPAMSMAFATSAHATPGAGRAAPGTPTGLRTIAGTKPEWAKAPALRGAASGSAGINLRIWLAGRDQAGLATFAREVSTPGTKEYRHFLTPAQFRARFGASAAQEKTVLSWARSQGLTVSAANQHYITVTGTVAAAGRAFSVQFGEYKDNGMLVRAPESDAQIPAAIAPSVLTVTGFESNPPQERPTDTLPPPPPNRWDAKPCSSSYGQLTASSVPTAYGAQPAWVTCGYSASQLRSAYGVTRSHLTGKGVTVAVVLAYADPTIVQDINQYSSDNGLPQLSPGQYTQDLPASFDGVSPCGASGWYTEQTIDFETLHAIAPGADLKYVAAADCGDPAFQDALLKIVDNHLADIVSNSWSDTEDQAIPFITAYESIWQQGAAEGIGFYFASGDAGINDPGTGIGAGVGSDRMQVNYPASSPWVTSVGGTALGIGATGNYEFETSYGDMRDPLASSGTSWSDPLPGSYPGDFYQGSGGGSSFQFGQPSYQSNAVPTSLSETLPGGATSSTPMREVPDVAMDADPFTGIDIEETTQQPDGSFALAHSRWGGTSLSTPLFAGMQALAQQALDIGVPGAAIGFANPEIYDRFNRGIIKPILPRSTPVDYALNWYTDPHTQTLPINTYLVTGGVDGAGSALLPLRDGYSDATGLGSVNYNYLESFLPCQAGACG